MALGGSLGRGYADRQSDIDLLVFGQGIPWEDDRRRLSSSWPGIRHGPLIEPACDSVLLDGAMVHMRFWTRQTVEDMLAAFPRPPEQRILAEELQNCHVLIDPGGLLGEWKAVLGRLPDALVKAVIGEVSGRRPRFRELWQAARQSDDWIHLYCLTNQAVNDFLIALYIRNGRFLSTPRWTHLDTHAFDAGLPDMGTSPPRLVDGIIDGEDLVARWTVLMDMWDRSENLDTTVE